MSTIVNPENLQLSPETLEKVEDQLKRLSRHVKGECQTRLFIRPDAKGSFMALLHVHAHHHSFVSERTAATPIEAVADAVRHVRRMLANSKARHVTERRHRTEVPHAI